MLTVLTERFKDLTEEEKHKPLKMAAGQNGLKHNGKTIGIFSDAMEPEDANFYKDLRWIKGIIQRVYSLGVGASGA